MANIIATLPRLEREKRRTIPAICWIRLCMLGSFRGLDPGAKK
jgi:hypothetical protein